MAVIAGDSAEDHAASSSSSRKMKFLCSFGGKILPRPSDGALRYVGGHTRIISVRRGSSFHELKSKMSDVFGGAAVLKYQLPDEDLDALVTVSSPEDLDNMMEEYDKLAEISPDGSVKLRVFLFSPSELDSQTLNLDPDINDCENKYVDAVNGIADIRLSEFLSAQTSDEAPGELLTCNFGGPSDAISSPIVAEAGTVASTGFQDPFELVYPPILPSDPVVVRVESKSISEEPPSSGLASISLDYLESLQVGFKGIKNLEQRDRIQYLNSHQFTAPIPQNSHVQDIESGSDQFFDVFASQKAEKTDQTSLTVDPEAPYSYFDDIIRQHQPPVGPPQFLLKQDLLVNDPLSVSIPTATKEIGQRSEVNLLLSEGSSGPDPWKAVVKPDTEVGDLLDGISVDHESAVDSAHEVNRIHLSQQGDQAHEGQKAISQQSNANHLAAIQSSKVNFQKSIPPTSYLDDKTVPPEKSNLGFGVLDDKGVRLQIIKNSDLEELRELGTGAFGTVYHGKWRGTDVAIKRINDRCFSGKPSEQERSRVDFWNEACKLADLHHPNVVAFYGVVIDGPGGSMATVTEFMVNGSLWQALRENDKSLDQWKRWLIAMDAAFGMEYLHGKNIVHFDLKSDNLLVNLGDPNRPICKVGDLGLSKVKRQTLISGGVRGTLPWMAPELLNGRSTLVSEKVDVFSFGIVMWELLTGEEPYADLHHGAIIGGIVSDTLRPTVPESCDPEWRALMVACWSTDPADRPSFTEIAGQLRSMAQQSPGSHVITA